MNSRETCLVTGLATSRQIGADSHFEDAAARYSFNYCWRIMYGCRFRRGPG